MLTSKTNLFGQGWIDAVFEGRNKEYGAYDLRKRESGVTVRAFLIGAALFVLLIYTPFLVKTLNGSIDDYPAGIDVTLKPVLPPPTHVVPPIPVAPKPTVKPSVAIRKLTPPVVAPPTETTEEIPSQKDWKNAIVGKINVDPAPEGGDIPIDRVAAPTTAIAIVDPTPIPMTLVQVQPSFPGGMAKFFEYVIWNLGGVTVDDNQDLHMKFRFVVERDGRLTDVQIVENGGHPEIAERAKSVLEKSPKWNPGVNNGRAVRVAFVLPITIKPAQ